MPSLGTDWLGGPANWLAFCVCVKFIIMKSFGSLNSFYAALPLEPSLIAALNIGFWSWAL